MRRLWIAGVLAVVVVGLLTTTAAVAGWFWDDPAWKVDGTEVHLMWAVDDPNGVADYRAEVGLIHPQGVDVQLLTSSTNRERAYDIASPKLEETERGIQVQGVFLVNARNGADGQNVLVQLVAFDHGKQTVLASGSGAMNGTIVLSAVVPD